MRDEIQRKPPRHFDTLHEANVEIERLTYRVDDAVEAIDWWRQKCARLESQLRAEDEVSGVG